MMKMSSTAFLALVALLITDEALSFSPMRNSFQPSQSTTTRLNEYGASSTSFYTDVEKKASYSGSEELLEAKCADTKVRQVITDMLEVFADITEALRTSLVTVEGTENDFGDTQLSVDVSVSRPKHL